MKRFLSLLLVALMMLTVLFVSISCSEEQKEPEPTGIVVTFDTQGGSTIDPVSLDPGATVVKPKKNPTQKGYVFLGWYTDKAGTKEYDFTAAVTESITIYAKWVDQTTYEHSDPILPKGSVALNNNSFSIPMTWSVDPNGKTGLPAVTYSFSGERTNVTNVSAELVAAVKNTPQSFFAETPTNVIFLFSDGWGVTGVNMSREYKGELILDSLPYKTESKTDSYKQYSFTDSSVNTDYSSHVTTDSCAGGTQVLAGYKTRYGYISMDVDANPVTTLIEAAHSKGWKTANVTNDNIVDATPSDAMIHDTNRYHSDVLYYKALKYALAEQGLDLLMGWDWGMSTYYASGNWASRLLNAEKEGIKDAISRQKLDSAAAKADYSDPIKYFKGLSTVEKYKMASFSVYYTLWENQDPARLNSFQRWTTTGAAELNQYLTWLESPTGLAAAIANLDATFANPADVVPRYTKFKDLVENTDFSKPLQGSWTSDGNDYESNTPNRGYTIHGSIGKAYPSWPEMVAYTIYQMDKEANDAGTGFFCIIENTCTDGWGHSGNQDTKVYSMMNEVQCFDEGVAIAVKYVLEHPDTLLVVSADHETGGYRLREGWENDFSLISSTTTGHSSQNVPLYAFGAGAQNFSAEAINAKYGAQANAGVEQNGKIHEGWITGALMGEMITGAAFGQTGKTEYKGQPFTTSGTPYGARLWEN